MKSHYFLSLILLTAMLGACAGPKPQPRAFSTAEAVIEQARRIGAGEYAPTELTHARERLAEARAGMEANQYEVANYLVEQAEINAELAIARSQVAIARERVQEKHAANRGLRQALAETWPGEFEE